MFSFDEIIILEGYVNKNSEALYIVKKSQSLIKSFERDDWED